MGENGNPPHSFPKHSARGWVLGCIRVFERKSSDHLSSLDNDFRRRDLRFPEFWLSHRHPAIAEEAIPFRDIAAVLSEA
jgi:hypothetical protein